MTHHDLLSGSPLEQQALDQQLGQLGLTGLPMLDQQLRLQQAQVQFQPNSLSEFPLEMGLPGLDALLGGLAAVPHPCGLQPEELANLVKPADHIPDSAKEVPIDSEARLEFWVVVLSGLGAAAMNWRGLWEWGVRALSAGGVL